MKESTEKLENFPNPMKNFLSNNDTRHCMKRSDGKRCPELMRKGPCN